MQRLLDGDLTAREATIAVAAGICVPAVVLAIGAGIAVGAVWFLGTLPGIVLLRSSWRPSRR